MDAARVTRPVRMASCRLSRLDPATDSSDVYSAIASSEGCSEEEVNVGEIRRLPGGRRVAWVRCPAAVAKSLTDRGCLSIGWSSVIVDSYRPQRLQCFKCWNFGHTRETCGSSIDRSELCFRCGCGGHKIRDCVNAPHCALCEANRFVSDHKTGSYACRSTSNPAVRNR